MKVYKSSGNIYEDLGVEDAKERHAKARVILKILEMIEHKDLSIDKAAKIIGIEKEEMERLAEGKHSNSTLEQLHEYYTVLSSK